MVAMCVRAHAGLSYSRWAVELGTLVQYAGLDADWQHLALFKLAQMVSPQYPSHSFPACPHQAGLLSCMRPRDCV
jgi:hypothetical protein